MKSVNLHLFASILLFCVTFSDCQTTPFDVYADVLVPDKTPVIPDETQKTYTTTIMLEKTSNGINFVATTFSKAAEKFYSSALQGFVTVNNVRSSEESNNKLQVTFDVKYAYPALNNSIDGSDSVVKDLIGNLEAVRRGLNAQGDFLTFYTVLEDEQAFSFDGSSICASASCTGAYVTCTETTDGISAACVSDCKTGYCGDDGICFHSDGFEKPTCRCTSLPDLWVIGERCETQFPLWLVVLLSVIGFLIVVAVILVVIILVRRKRRKQKRKTKLLNSAPKSFQNNGFVNDELMDSNMPLQTTVASTRSNLVTSMARSDSFETVTSSEMPPSEYRPRSHGERRSYENSSAPLSRHHHKHHEDRHHRTNNHHHHHHRSRRHSDDSTRRRESSKIKERLRETQQQRPPSSGHSTSDDSSDEVKQDSKNLSFYEVEVNDLDLETDVASSEVATSSIKSSPIRWLPPKDNGTRPGWVPSLGPMMYDLPGGKKTNINPPKQREGGTDV